MALVIAGLALAQTHKPFQSQSPASVAYGINKDGQQTVEIANVAYEVTSTGVPGRPQNERLLLRTTTRTKQVVDDIGMEAATTLEAWPLGCGSGAETAVRAEGGRRGCEDGGRRVGGDSARSGRHGVVVGLQTGNGRAALRYLYAVARVLDPAGYPDHALRGLRHSGTDHAEELWWAC